MNKIKILCLGDSLTQGYNIGDISRWTDLLHNDVDAEVINSGISGDTTTGMLARCERLLIAYRPTHIIILGGTNDLWFGLKDEFIISNIHAMVRQARYYNALPIVGIPTAIINNRERNFIKENYSDRINRFQDLLRAYCLVDNQYTINFSENMDDTHFLNDGLHPNESGQVVMKTNALNVLLKLLKLK